MNKSRDRANDAVKLMLEIIRADPHPIQAPFTSQPIFLEFLRQGREKYKKAHPDYTAPKGLAWVSEEEGQLFFTDISVKKRDPELPFTKDNVFFCPFEEGNQVGPLHLTPNQRKILTWFEENDQILKQNAHLFKQMPPFYNVSEKDHFINFVERSCLERMKTAIVPYLQGGELIYMVRQMASDYWDLHGGPYIYSCDGSRRYKVPLEEFRLDVAQNHEFTQAQHKTYGSVKAPIDINKVGMTLWDGLWEKFPPSPYQMEEIQEVPKGTRCAAHGTWCEKKGELPETHELSTNYFN